MKSMKKFSMLVMAIAILCVGVLFSACTQKDNASITFNQSNATIYLGETENNQVSILATLKNVEVNKLDLVYDTSFVSITQEKNLDGTFTITVKSLIDYGTKPIAVEVKASNKTSAIFYVDIVLPLQRIVAKDNLYVAYNGEKTTYNLIDFISFEPEGTVQKGVEFSLPEESEQYHIENNKLVVEAGVDVNQLSQIKVDVTSTVIMEGKEQVSAELNIKLIPNIKLLADNIAVSVDHNGDKTAVQNKAYELTIKKEADGYKLGTFEVEVVIPQSLGIEVDLDSSSFGGLATNILNYLSYSRRHTLDTTNASNIKDVYTFTFETRSSLQGKGDLRMKYWYKDYSNDKDLSANFIAKVENEIIDKLTITATMPITNIEVRTDCVLNADTNIYTIYNNYKGTYGEAFTLVALPEGTSQKTIVLEKEEDCELQIYNSKGNLLPFVRNIYDENGTLIETKNNQQEILSGETIYIKGANRSTESLTYFSSITDKETLTRGTLVFNVANGTSALGFVENTESTDLKEDIVLNAEINNSAVTYLLAPNAKVTDFIKDDNVVIEPVLGKDNYFKVTFSAVAIGKKAYTIKTINGYKVTANLNVIQPLDNIVLKLKDNSQYLAGIGDYAPKDNNSDLVNISIEKGYSIALDYAINKNAQISKIKYSFYAPQNIDVYGEEISKLKDVYNYNYPTLFDELSLVLNNQNLVQNNIITGVNSGINIIKIEIYGQKVQNGQLIDEIKDTKYLFVQIYNPVKQINSTAKNITLRTADQVASSYESLTTKTLTLNVTSAGDEKATYNKIFIDGSSYDLKPSQNGENELVCSKIISKDGVDAIEVIYNFTTGKLNIKANKYIKFTEQPQIILFAGDFVDFENGRHFYTDSTNRPIITYVLTINLLETKAIEDISVSNLELDTSKSDNTTKVYKTIYIDTSKAESITYKLLTEITPFDAFDKALKYNFIANSGSTQAMIDIDDNGLITILGEQGGSGVITIEPKNNREGMSVKTVRIPIVVSDGNSWETAYEITSLEQIKYSNKHYVLTIPTTYTLTETLFESLEGGFRGGLYGRRFNDTESSKATIRLQGVSLFNILSSTAIIADLDICGDVSATEFKNSQGSIEKFTSRGFVASVNAGRIVNVKVTSYLQNGAYVPSLLTVGANVTMVGGIAGENKGIIENCTFAGSINVRNNTTLEANAIATNTTGTILNNKVITAKYDSSIQALRLVVDGENYVNGVVGGTNTIFADIDNDKVVEENYKDYEFSGNIWIANYQSEGTNLNHSYGEEDSPYGLIFYYLAKDSTKQSSLDILNIIPFSKLFGLKNTEITTNNLKVLALNLDGSLCDFVGVDSQGITLNGIGQFVLSVSSEYDYTTTYNLNILSMYQASDFSLSSNGAKLDKNSLELEIIYGEKYEIISKINNLISIINAKGQRETIELAQNDYDVLFTVTYEGMPEEINAENYITGKKLGSHTLNMTFEWYNKTNIKVSLFSGNGTHFDTLLNKFFNITDGDAGEFNVRRRNGTSEIVTNIKEGSIEPKDTFTFLATLTTDVSNDIVDTDTIEIYTENNISITEQEYFDVFVEKDATKENTFRIQISVNQDRIRNAGYNLLDFVARRYTILVKAKNSTGIDDKIYNVSQEVYLNLLPQTISNINTVLYGVTSSTTTGVNVSNKETPTSVLIPSGKGGLFVIDMFPAYASYDYIDVVATSNTISKLSFRLQERIEDAGELTNNYKNTNNGYEPLYGKNGIRLLNNNNKDNQNIGTYYLKVFADASFSGDTIFTITVNAYYNDSILSASSVFTLFMKMPEAPQISLNGESKIYTLAGQSIENIEVLVSNEQINPTAQIASNLSGESLIDGKSTSAIHCNMREVSNNTLVGYKKYLITVTFDDDYVTNLSVNSTKFKIVVTSIKISNGSEIPVSAEMYVYVVDYKALQNDIRIFNASEDIFKVTSLKYLELKLADLLPEEVNATQEFINFFNENYYYSNPNSEFVFGRNNMMVAGEEKLLTKAQILASYLSYVKGNVKTPLVKIGQNNELELVSTEYLTFDIQDDKLLVKGGNYTGSTSMVLEIEYIMPDGKVFTYEYNFEIVNSLYTTEDLPKEIANVDSFLDIENQDEAFDYILTNDLYLYDYKSISSTTKIASLDGNNHTIHIINFAEDENESDFALFKTISNTTTIKNLTVNIYHLRQIVVSSKVTDANIAGFAIQNDGAIYNCEVVAFDNESLPAMSSTYGIKVDKDINTKVAGFVLTNNGSITNSRFGGTNKLVTKVVYITNDEGKVVNSKVAEQTYLQKMLTIQASGTISGFVDTNNGIIASSFAKNIDIQNTYYKLETKVTAGFVNTNNGTISMSYAEGGFENNTDIRALRGGLEGTGIMTGFAYINNGKITDSYSNLSITNTKEQVGRLGAGFVFENGESGVIERCYSASKVLSNNITQMNFAGIKDFGGYNNLGTIKTSYYYIENSTEEISIENILGTTINSIINVSDKKEFYGFSFVDGNKAGTWNINSKGRLELVSADDIAHSVRAKNENTTGANTGIEYYFTYCSGYELGSNNNPIIIRDAKEFNAVFGNSVSTDIQDCYNLSTAKVYGSYRLVNDINMLDLVPKEEQETEYKVSLVSTKMTLSGEYNHSSNKGGTINGNGLTITNLAISNSSSVSNNYGLFKSIENGASISNINIELAKSGVSADHTVFVGTIAGSLIDSYANNIYIKGISGTESTKVVGANVTGGAFGRVIGDSKVSSCKIENVSVTSTYFENYLFDRSSIEYTNVYNRLDESSYSALSIAGGMFGVVDLYTIIQQDNSAVVSAVDSQQSGVSNISVTGGMYIEGMTAGGIAGFVGNYVIARDLSLTLNKGTLKSGIIAYNCYAGGIVGFNRGYLYQVKAEHENSWQSEIERNMQNYYQATDDTRESIERGNLDLFESELYTPYSVGGLVGVQQSGKISIAYSKLNVINTKAKNVGGIVGYICTAFSPENVNEGDIVSFTMHETYAVGDVYSESNNANIGGVIGKNYDESIKLTKVNALNYWGINSYNIFKNGLNNINVNSIANYTDAGIKAESATHVYSMSGVKFSDSETVTFIDNSDIDVMCPYYDYDGVLSDNGAQVDLMFSKKEWYLENNWSRDLTELFPHIVYVSPRNQYTISSMNDFDKFARYGNDPNVTFIVIDYDKADPSKGDDDLLIPCNEVNVTYGLMRAKIVGATAKNGFRYLNIPLFSEMNGNEVSTLRFLECSAPLTQRANNEQFSYLTYSNCNFSVKTNKNIGGIAQEINNKCKFTNISFTGCTINAGGANNAGMLFGSHNQGVTSGVAVEINNVKIGEGHKDVVNKNVVLGNTTVNNSTYNYGILFGEAGQVRIENAKVYDKMSINLNSPKEINEESGDKPVTANIGLLAGSTSYLEINLQRVSLTAGENGMLSVDCKDDGLVSEFDGISLNLNVGGIVGNCSGKIILSVNEQQDNADGASKYVNVSYAPSIKVDNTQYANSQYIGSVCGIANEIRAEENGIYIFGKTEEANGESQKIIYKSLEYSLAEKTEVVSGVDIQPINNIGGIAGTANLIASSIEGTDTIQANPGIIAYYGDMKSSVQKGADINYLNLGGIVGIYSPKNDQKDIISNIIFDGTISFADSYFNNDNAEMLKNLYVRAGGVVGYINGDGALIKNTIASGEIILTDRVGHSLKTTDNMHIAGLVGFNAGTTKLGTEGVDGEGVSVITTIFSLTGAKGVDSIAHNSNSGHFELYNTVKYSSSLNLVVSSLQKGDSVENPNDYLEINKPDGVDEYLINTEYGQLNEGNMSVWKVANNTVKGSKLDPYYIDDEDTLTEKDKTDKVVNDEYYFTKTKSGKNGANSGADIVTYTSTYIRKLYIGVKGDKKLPNQISLENTILFSQGAELFSTITPINQIDENSAVTGLVVKLYIDESEGSEATNRNDYFNLAGLANINKGIIYTCSVQESMTGFKEYNNSTNFYGHFYSEIDYEKVKNAPAFTNPKLPKGIAGFVANNKGYIFGSNANVELTTKTPIVASNFVVANEGVISYCYATGLNDCNEGYVFVAEVDMNAKNDEKDAVKKDESVIENSYSIVKAVNPNVSKYVPKGVYVESDASELKFTSQNIVLYKATEQVKDGNNTNKLIIEDKNGYYACDPYYNYNYPTLTGGLFKNFTFLKRSTMVEKDENTGMYKERDIKVTYSDTQYSAVDGYNYTGIGFNYYRDVLYCQIPNLTVLKDLNAEGVGDNCLTSSYSKFVIIGDINVGYNIGVKEKDYIDKTTGTSTLGTIATTTQLYGLQGDKVVEISEYADVVIDGQNKTLKNLVYRDDIKLIDEITNIINGASTGKGVTIKNIQFDRISIGGNTVGLINHASSGTILDNITFINNSSNTNEEGTNNAGVTIRTGGYTTGKNNDSYGLVYTTDIEKGVTQNVIGVLVGTNEGLVQNCSFLSSITTDGMAKGSYALGSFVGYNKGSGQVNKCSFAGNVCISEYFNNSTKQDLDLQVVFGGIVAVNATDKNIIAMSENIIEPGSLTDYVLTSGGTIYKQSSFSNDQLTSLLANAPDVSKYQLNAQIYVITSNKAVVGGIVGIIESGIVNRSSTYKNSNAQEYTIMVGDEYSQRVAYAGGIAGIVKAEGNIQDCSNRSNISTMAIWLFTTNDESMANYRFGLDKIASRTSEKSNYLGDRVLFTGEDNSVFEMTTKLDNAAGFNKNAKLYVYKDMISLAYSGGIAGYGISNVESSSDATLGNARLANYGTINGGFRARKPVAIIYNKGYDRRIVDSNLAFWTAAIVSFGTNFGVKPAITAITTGGLAGKLIGLSLLVTWGFSQFEYVKVFNEIYDSLTHINLFVDGFIGSSPNYHRDNNFVLNLFADSKADNTKWNKNAIAKLNKALSIKELTDGEFESITETIGKGVSLNIGKEIIKQVKDVSDYTNIGDFIDNSNVLWSQYFAVLVNNRAMTKYSPVTSLANTLSEICSSIGFKGAKNAFSKPEMVGLTDVISEDLSYSTNPQESHIHSVSVIKDYINCKVNEESKNAEYMANLNSYSYDGICPSLIGTVNKNLTVYSKTSNFYEKEKNNDIVATLNTINADNRLIEFKIADCEESGKKYSFMDNYGKDNNIGVVENAIDSWSTNEHQWITSRDNCKIPRLDSETTIGVDPSDPSAIVEKEDGSYEYTLTDAKNWAKIVNTVNDANKGVIDGIDTEKCLNMTIIVNLNSGQTEIPVGRNTFDKFNGTIIFRNSNYRFTNLVLSDNQEDDSNTGVGLIKQTNGVKLISVSVKGTVSFSVSEKEEKTLNAGILVGEVVPQTETDKLEISSSRIVPSKITFSEISLTRITNFGGLVGSLTVGNIQPQEDLEDQDKDTIYQSKLNNITIGSNIANESQFVINTQKLNIAEDTNKNLGGVVGYVDSVIENADTLVLNKISTLGKINLISEFNNVGGIIGAIGSTSVQFGEIKKTDDIVDSSAIQLDLGIASYSNTYVGGIVGHNGGYLIDVVTPLNVGTETGITVSADVINETKYAFAGGLIGNNQGYVKNDKNNINMGNKILTSFSSISYVFAGYNGMNLESRIAIPKMANAGIFVGFGNSINGVGPYSFIAKHMYNDFTSFTENTSQAISPNWDDIDKTFSVSKDKITLSKDSGKYTLFTTEKQNGYDYLVSKNINYEEKSDYIKLDYSYTKVDEDTAQPITLVKGIVLDSTKKIGYKITPLTYNNFVTSNANDVTHKEWKLEISYIEETKNYNIETANIDATYEYIISLVSSNARVEDSGRYTLIIKQTKGYDIVSENIGKITLNSSLEDLSKNNFEDFENTTTTVPIEKTKYIQDENISLEKPIVLASKTFNLNDFNEDPTKDKNVMLLELKDVFNYTLEKKISESNKSNTDNIDKIVSMSSSDSKSTFKNTSLSFNINYSASNKKYTLQINDNYTLNISNSSLSYTGEVTDDSITGIQDPDLPEDDEKERKAEKDYTRIIVLTSDISSGDLKSNNVVNIGEFTNRYSIYINRQNKEEAPIKTGEYSEPNLLNEEIYLPYSNPRFVFKGDPNEYDTIKIFKYTNEDKNTSYIIASCMLRQDDYEMYIKEYVYAINSNSGTLEYYGNVSYRLTGANGKLVDEIYAMFFENNNIPARHESYFPSFVIDGVMYDNAAYDFTNNILKTPQTENIVFVCYTTRQTVEITSKKGDMTYTYRVISDRMKEDIVISTNKTGEVVVTNGAKQATGTTNIGETTTLRFQDKTALDGLLNAEKKVLADCESINGTAPGEVNVSSVEGKIVNYWVYGDTVVALHSQYQETHYVDDIDEDGNYKLDENGNIIQKEIFVTVDKYYKVIANQTVATYDSIDDIFFFVSLGTYNNKFNFKPVD